MVLLKKRNYTCAYITHQDLLSTGSEKLYRAAPTHRSPAILLHIPHVGSTGGTGARH